MCKRIPFWSNISKRLTEHRYRGMLASRTFILKLQKQLYTNKWWFAESFSIIGLSLSTTTENSFGRPCIPVMRHQGNHKNEHPLLQEKSATMEFNILKVKILSTDLMFPITKSKTSTAIKRSQGHSVICLNTHMIRLLYLIDVASVQTKTLTFRYLHFTI